MLFGDTGTFNASMPAEWFDSYALGDTPRLPGTGSELWSVNTWALEWAKDYETAPASGDAQDADAVAHEEDSTSGASSESDKNSDDDEDSQSMAKSDELYESQGANTYRTVPKSTGGSTEKT